MNLKEVKQDIKESCYLCCNREFAIDGFNFSCGLDTNIIMSNSDCLHNVCDKFEDFRNKKSCVEIFHVKKRSK